MLLFSILPVIDRVPCIIRLEPIKLPPSEKYEALAPAPGHMDTVFPPVLGNIVLHLTAFYVDAGWLCFVACDNNVVRERWIY